MQKRGCEMKCRTFIIGISILIFTVSAISQTEKPTFTAYKGVSIGMTIEKARSILGNPKEKAEGQDFYKISESESFQVYFDSSQTVTALMVTFSGTIDAAPTPKDVFGEDVAANADGSIFKMVRYPKAGFWISYNRSLAEDKMVSIAMQKIN